jgi:hypothetical protein
MRKKNFNALKICRLLKIFFYDSKKNPPTPLQGRKNFISRLRKSVAEFLKSVA